MYLYRLWSTFDVYGALAPMLQIYQAAKHQHSTGGISSLSPPRGDSHVERLFIPIWKNLNLQSPFELNGR